MAGTWRDRARVIVADVLRKTTGQSEREVRKALHDAYPFGPREYWPYQVWLDEIARQRNTTTGRIRRKQKPEPVAVGNPLQERLL